MQGLEVIWQDVNVIDLKSNNMMFHIVNEKEWLVINENEMMKNKFLVRLILFQITFHGNNLKKLATKLFFTILKQYLYN